MPVAKGVPPEVTSYQRIELPLIPGVPFNVIVPLPHRAPLVAVGDDGNGFTVAVTGIRVELSHPVPLW